MFWIQFATDEPYQKPDVNMGDYNSSAIYDSQRRPDDYINCDQKVLVNILQQVMFKIHF